MITDLLPGDPVRLQPAYAAKLEANPRSRRDWPARRGIIQYLRRGSLNAYVIWSGNKNVEQVPVRVLEKVAP